MASDLYKGQKNVPTMTRRVCCHAAVYSHDRVFIQGVVCLSARWDVFQRRKVCLCLLSFGSSFTPVPFMFAEVAVRITQTDSDIR